MNKAPALALVVVSSLLAGGCATKKYVKQQTAPIQAKVDQVGDQTNKNSTDLESTRTEVKAVDERATSGISQAKERAMTAENRANEAMTKATEAGTVANDAKMTGDKNSREIADVRGELRGVVANIDDYKVKAETAVTFGFGKSTLNKESMEALDKLVTDKGDAKRFVVSVAGYTDKVGSPEYNLELSRKRANAVVHYLVSKHNVPVYRIYTVGLGKDNPVDEATTRAARAKNRRVEVKVFAADIPSRSEVSSAAAPATGNQ